VYHQIDGDIAAGDVGNWRGFRVICDRVLEKPRTRSVTKTQNPPLGPVRLRPVPPSPRRKTHRHGAATPAGADMPSLIMGMAQDTPAQSSRTHPSRSGRSTQHELRDAEERAWRLRASGVNVVKIAGLMGMSARTIRRLLSSARERHTGAIAQDEVRKLVVDSFATFEQIATLQWEQYHRAPTTGSALAALAALVRVEKAKLDLLRALGLLRPEPKTEASPATVDPLPWSPDLREKVTAALLAQCVSRPLAEPALDPPSIGDSVISHL
jgi:hypothetical protein